MLEFLTSEWEDSYSRFENNLFEPYEELVKFLARFVYNRVPETGKIIPKGRFNGKDLSEISFIDIGCGIGAQSEYLAKLGFKVKGFDISKTAIDRATARCSRAGLSKSISFTTINPNNFKIDYKFDIAIACASLDSMSFDIAKEWISQVGQNIEDGGMIFATLIGASDEENFTGEKIITNEVHENGTIQSYFDEEKIHKLLACGNFVAKRIDIVERSNVLPQIKASRSSKRYTVVAIKQRQ